ncbi:MAG: hypothetical protein GF333_08190 [Candidatus Omnitrophica bacterium]|nr:hypothetical protein [Candidatus Omnitrophota bacterium]
MKSKVAVILFGIVCILGGGTAFLAAVFHTITFFHEGNLFLKALQVITGIAPSQGEILQNILWQNSMQHPVFFLVQFFILPALAFLFVLGGVGIIRRREEWRRMVLLCVVLYPFFYFVKSLYLLPAISLFYIKKSVYVIADPSDLYQSIVFQLSVFRDYLFLLGAGFGLLAACCVYFLTRAEVKKQFAGWH